MTRSKLQKVGTIDPDRLRVALSQPGGDIVAAQCDLWARG